MNIPLVSVIIPTYKRSSFLKRAIRSVIDQTYKNIEIIIVDDNYDFPNIRKQTEEIIKFFIENESLNEQKIKLCKANVSLGGAEARNLGLRNSIGKYICFLDDDDVFLPKKIEQQVKVFVESKINLSVVGGNANIVDINGKLIRKEISHKKGDVYLYQLEKNLCTTSIAMIDSETALKVNGFTKIESSQEHLFFIKIFRENPYYDYIDESVVDIYHHEGERISNNKKKADGARSLLRYIVEDDLPALDNITRNKIIASHLLNISLAYLSLGQKRSAFKYLFKKIKIQKKITKSDLKRAVLIIIGINFYNTILKIKNNRGQKF